MAWAVRDRGCLAGIGDAGPQTVPDVGGERVHQPLVAVERDGGPAPAGQPERLVEGALELGSFAGPVAGASLVACFPGEGGTGPVRGVAV